MSIQQIHLIQWFFLRHLCAKCLFNHDLGLSILILLKHIDLLLNFIESLSHWIDLTSLSVASTI